MDYSLARGNKLKLKGAKNNTVVKKKKRKIVEGSEAAEEKKKLEGIQQDTTKHGN
jgi:hypothetical protein